MSDKTIGAAEFKAKCLRVISDINKSREPVTITKHGRPVAVLMPAEQPSDVSSLFGAMAGTVSHYDDPSALAADSEDWNALT